MRRSRQKTAIVIILAVLLMIMISWVKNTSEGDAVLTDKLSVESNSPASPLETNSSEKVSAKRLQDVLKIVEERNAGAKEHLNHFINKGWKLTEAPTADPLVMRLDPSLLGSQDAKLIRQLATTSLREENIENAILIAKKSDNTRLRRLAITALKRSRYPKSKRALQELFDSVRNDDEKRRIIGSFHPTHIEEPEVDWLIKKLRDHNVSAELKEHILVTLVSSVEQFQGEQRPTLPQALLNRIPEQWHERLFQAYASRFSSDAPHPQ